VEGPETGALPHTGGVTAPKLHSDLPPKPLQADLLPVGIVLANHVAKSHQEVPGMHISIPGQVVSPSGSISSPSWNMQIPVGCGSSCNTTI
jgi:hypothetical protein